MELAKLKSENEKLEEQLSANKVKSTEFDYDKDKYTSRIAKLENEREIIITDIKQLEMWSVGDSALAPNNCDVEHVLMSLDRIRQYLDVRSTKSSALEQAHQKMLNFVQSKANEATKIVENEKQKIITEKEEAIRDKINMEKQLVDLRQTLESQISHDKAVIKDLEAEILNQKLIIDKVNKSTQSYINKLEEEMKTLRDMYKNALGHISELEIQLTSIKDKHDKDVDVIGKANKYLDEKCTEIDLLKKQLSELQKPVSQDVSTQKPIIAYQSTASQTDRIMEEEHFIRYEKDDTERTIQDSKDRSRNTLHKDKSKPMNTVHVLTANVEPNFEYDKDDHSNNKQQQVSGKQLEQYSLSAAGPSNLEGAVINKHKQSGQKQDLKTGINVNPVTRKKEQAKVIDIYNKQSIETNSSKGNYESKLSNRKDQNNIPRNPNQFSDSIGSEVNINNRVVYSTSFESRSVASTDKDLFVIYHDSDSAHGNLPNTQWQNRQSEILVESMTVQQKLEIHRNDQKIRQQNKSGNILSGSIVNTEDLEEDDSVKPKIKIDLPRVDMDTHSVDNSEIGKKSLDSYTLSKTTDGSSKLRKPQTESLSIEHSNYPTDSVTAKTKQTLMKKVNDSHTNDETSSNLTKTYRKGSDNAPESDYKLSRVGADVLLIKTDNNNKRSQSKSRESNEKNFALDYILDSVEQEGLGNFQIYDAAKALKKARSEERFNNIIKIRDRSDSSPSRFGIAIKSSSVNPKSPTIGYSPSKTSENSYTKSYKERSVMAKIDPVEKYEKKIRCLSNTLESIQKDYKKKIEVIKTQYDNNIKSLINEHNQGVQSIQNLHEETLHDIIKMHENEVENWRTMSIEAMRKADVLDKEMKLLKNKVDSSSTGLDEVSNVTYYP